jgi:hypothetical protein
MVHSHENRRVQKIWDRGGSYRACGHQYLMARQGRRFEFLLSESLRKFASQFSMTGVGAERKGWHDSLPAAIGGNADARREFFSP